MDAGLSIYNSWDTAKFNLCTGAVDAVYLIYAFLFLGLWVDIGAVVIVVTGVT